jgi:drug/metabolite transporter (DMT)-like permease
MTSENSDRSLVGIGWMLLAGLCFVAVTALVKSGGDRIPPVQAAFLRYLLGLVFLLPMLKSLLSARIDRRIHSMMAARGVVHALGVMMWFFAMTRIPLAEVTAMGYLSPIYVSLGAVLFLGERMAFRRVTAIFAAIVGALIILRPGMREISSGHLAMLITAASFGVSYLLAKSLSGKVSAAVIVAGLSIWVTVILAPFAWSVWVVPTASELWVLFGVACFATMGHYVMTLAFAAAPVTVTQPVTFLQLVWATLLGTLVFHEPLDGYVLAGGGLILAAVTFITWREAVLKRRATTQENSGPTPQS